MTWIVGSKIIISNLHRQNFHEGGSILITTNFLNKRTNVLSSETQVY